MRIGIVVWCVAGVLSCLVALFMAACCMDVMTEKWAWFLPGAATALIGICWAAPAMRRGLPARALSRLYAAAVLSLGLSWEVFRAGMQFFGR